MTQENDFDAEFTWLVSPVPHENRRPFPHPALLDQTLRFK
jgi:hypothetical protein